MKCENCGKRLPRKSNFCKFCGVTIQNKISLKSNRVKLTNDQKKTLKSIRTYEKKNKVSFNKEGLSKYYNELSSKRKLKEQDKLEGSQEELIEQFKAIKIPIQIPFDFPKELIEEIKDKKISKITIEEDDNSIKLKIGEDEKQNELIEFSKSKLYNLTTPISAGKKLPYIGLGLETSAKEDKEKTTFKNIEKSTEEKTNKSTTENSDESKTEKTEKSIVNKLNLIIPQTPTNLIDSNNKNQGDLIYKKCLFNKSESSNKENPNNQDEDLNQLLSEMLKKEVKKDFFNTDSVDNIAWQNFSYYEYLQEPKLFKIDLTNELSKEMLELLGEIELPPSEVSKLLAFISKINQTIRFSVTATLRRYEYLPDIQSIWEYHFDKIVEIYQSTFFRSGAVSTFYELYSSLTNSIVRQLFLNSLIPTEENINRYSPFLFNYNNLITAAHIEADYNYQSLFIIISEWTDIAENVFDFWQQDMSYYIDDSNASKIDDIVENQLLHNFESYLPNSVNLGLRLVYRQEWRPLGLQRGDIVKTIPLGPKQVEKVSTKITRRSKVTSSSEVKTEFEISTETTDTTKDSTELVNETAKNNKWKAEANGSFGIGGFQIGGGYSESGDESQKNSNTTTNLTEAVKNTAGKFRSETKVTVSTEKESTFELSTSSEIQNPNDELPVSYFYKELQQQYEVLTRLAEVQSVVYIAETIPLPHQVTPDWVKKYDWILAKVLLDESFKNALLSISQETEAEELDTEAINGMMSSASTGLGTLAGMAGSGSLSNVDVIQEAQKAYRETHKENLEKKKLNTLLVAKQNKLLQHIRDNILHYCRAIWQEEDNDQRMLRYKKLDIRIPTVWRYRLNGVTIEPGRVILTENGLELVFDRLPLNGYFEPYLSDPESVKPVTELIDPSGPIGFTGNYAIFQLKISDEIEAKYRGKTFNLLHYLKSNYIDLATGDFTDPIIKAMKNPSSTSYMKFPPDNFDEKLKKEMISYVPELRNEYNDLEDDEKVNYLEDGFLPDERKKYNAIIHQDKKEDYKLKHSAFANSDFYYEYRFRKEYSRKIIVDTNNLILEMDEGLEPFKKTHRYVDAKKAIREEEKMGLENEKLSKENTLKQKLIDEENIQFPNIDKLVVLSGIDKLSDVLAINSDNPVPK